MKKIMTLTLGLALVMGLSAFGADEKKTDEKKMEKKGKKKGKKTEEKK